MKKAWTFNSRSAQLLRAVIARQNERHIGDRVIIMMQYGEETVTIISVDCDARGFDVEEDVTHNQFWISADDILRDEDIIS